MKENKTKATAGKVSAFLKKVDADRREDCEALVAMMKKATRAEPVMWGAAIIGFGQRRLVYDSGRELDWFKIGFSPRKSDLTLYGLGPVEPDALEKLGKHKTGKGCLYVKRLSDVDTRVLERLVRSAARRPAT